MVALTTTSNDLLDWEAVIKGPKDTPFEGGQFRLHIQLTEAYPSVPPYVTFETPIFHPNVHFKSGEVCLDILKSEWSPSWTLHAVVCAIMVLLSTPEGDSPLNCDAGTLVRLGDLRGYRSMARMYVEKHAMGHN